MDEQVEEKEIIEVNNLLNDEEISSELIERASRFVESHKIVEPVGIYKYKDESNNEYEKTIAVGTIFVSSTVTKEQLYDLQRQYGVDVHKMVGNSIKNELYTILDRHILSRLFALGWGHNITIDDSIGGYTVKDSIIETPAYYYINGYTEELSVARQDVKSLSVIKKDNILDIFFDIIERYKNNSYQNSFPEYLLTNITINCELQFDGVLELSERYTIKYEPVSNMLNGRSIYQTGNLILTDSVVKNEYIIKCYCDPFMAAYDTRVLLGRISKDYEGSKFFLYKSVDDVKYIEIHSKNENGDECSLAPQIRNKSRYALSECEHENGLAQKNYMTLFISI